MSGYLSPLACMLMRHASPFIMMVGNQVFATGAVQYRLLLGRSKKTERCETPTILKLFGKT
uniref:Uncharacterized protein n=2 Tax=Triticum urartu TaxID=4572 RepID=A0A8R7UFQ0_TRIUA